MLRGIDWGSPVPPPGYVPGRGRGETGFVTNIELGAFRPKETKSKGKHDQALAQDDEFARLVQSRGRIEDPKGEVSNVPRGNYSDLLAALAAMPNEERESLREGNKSRPSGASLPDERPSKVPRGEGIKPQSLSAALASIHHTDNALVHKSEEVVSEPSFGVEDVAFARVSEETKLILKDRTLNNPSEAINWIRLARAYFAEGRRKQAVATLRDATKTAASTQSTLWRELVKVLDEPQAKRVAAEDGVRACSSDEDLWLLCAKLQPTSETKQEKLHEAVCSLPNSEKLWITVLDEEPAENHEAIIKAALKACPTLPLLWIRLADMKTTDDAMRLVNAAIGKNPLSIELWLHYARLKSMSTNGDESAVMQVLKRAVQAIPQRSTWFDILPQVAAEHPVTARSILRCLFSEVESPTWREDMLLLAPGHPAVRAQVFVLCHLSKGAVPPSARQITEYAQHVFTIAGLAGVEGATSELLAKYAEVADVWLTVSDALQTFGAIEMARNVLSRGVEVLPSCSTLWSALAKCAALSTGDMALARSILQKGIGSATSDSLFVDLAVVERADGSVESALKEVDRGIEKFPRSDDLIVLKAQLLAQQGCAVDVLDAILRSRPDVARLWKEVAVAQRFVLQDRQRGRSTLDEGLQRHRQDEELRIVKVEWDCMDFTRAEALASAEQAHRAIPLSSVLLAWTIDLEAPSLRPRKARDIIRVQHEPSIPLLLAVARIYRAGNRVSRAIEEIEKAITKDPLDGDSYALLYVLTRERKESDVRWSSADVIKRAKEVKPYHGYHWSAVARDPSNATLVGTRKNIEEMLEATADRMLRLMSYS